MKYEYLRRIITRDDELNTLGSEGWELISVDSGKFYFKRELTNIKKGANLDD